MLLTGSAWPQPESFEGTRFERPAGWQQTEQKGTRTLSAPPAAPGEALIVVISAARPSTGDPAAELSQFAAALERSGRRLSAGAMQHATRGGLTVVTMHTRVEQAGLGVHERVYEVVSDGRTNAYAAAVLRGDRTFQAQRDALAQVLGSVAPAGAAAIPATTGQPVPVGSDNFRPSGSGKPFPLPALVNGSPVGLWWYATPLQGTLGMVLVEEIFFPDGTNVQVFRPGGPQSVDLDGMRALGQEGSIGRFSVAGGTMTVTWNDPARTTMRAPLRPQTFAGQQIFEWSDRLYQPGLPLATRELVGTWRTSISGELTFRADGTLSATRHLIDPTDDGTVPLGGTWALDGYLLALHLGPAGDRVFPVFRTPKDAMVFKGRFFTRQ